MNKRFIRILVLLILIVVTAMAVAKGMSTATASGSAYNWESADVTIVESVKSGDQTTLTLQDKDQQLFKVSYPGNSLPDDVARIIVKYKNEFFSCRNLEMKEIKFVLSLDILEIIIIPTRIMYNGNNIVSAIPAGIVFSYDPASPGAGLRYDFKILKDNLIVRMTGKYTTEAEFDQNLFRIYDNPKNYQSTTGKIPDLTPTPTGKPLGTVTGTPITAPTGNQVVTPTGTPTGKTGVTPTGRSARIIGPTRPQVTVTPTGAAGTPTPTSSTGTTLTAADFEFLLDKIIQLQAENERLRYALLALENKGLSGASNPVSREVILHVIRVKRQYPALTFDELFSQLKKEGVHITKQELYLILAVYFNEFNDQYL